MTISNQAKKRLEIALGGAQNQDAVAREIIEQIDGVTIAALAEEVDAIGTTSNLSAANAVLSTTDTYTDAAVKAAIDGAVNALRSQVESRLDVIEAKIDELLAAQKAAGQMDS